MKQGCIIGCNCLNPARSIPKGQKSQAVKGLLKRMLIGWRKSLVEDYTWADWVAGMNSMALVVVLMVKEVFCSIPGHSRPASFPHEGIRSFLGVSEVC